MIIKYLSLCFRQLSDGFGALFFAGTFLLAGCDRNTSVEEPNPQIVDVLIQLNGSSDKTTIDAGETVEFIGFAVTESGDKIPLSELNENWSGSGSRPILRCLPSILKAMVPAKKRGRSIV